MSRISSSDVMEMVMRDVNYAGPEHGPHACLR